MSSEITSDASRGGEPTPPAPQPPYARPPKSPGLALFLSFLMPGIGQAYNGHAAKAVVFFFAVFGSIYATIDTAMRIGHPFPFVFLIPFLYFWNLVDAFRGAAAINARAAGGQPPEEDAIDESPAWGITLVALGLVLLLRNLGWLNLAFVRDWWPVGLIVAGGYFLRESLRRRSKPLADAASSAPEAQDGERR